MKLLGIQINCFCPAFQMLYFHTESNEWGKASCSWEGFEEGGIQEVVQWGPAPLNVIANEIKSNTRSTQGHRRLKSLQTIFFHSFHSFHSFPSGDPQFFDLILLFLPCLLLLTYFDLMYTLSLSLSFDFPCLCVTWFSAGSQKYLTLWERERERERGWSVRPPTPSIVYRRIILRGFLVPIFMSSSSSSSSSSSAAAAAAAASFILTHTQRHAYTLGPPSDVARCMKKK